ncbi:unnamed protein product [Camellia sinensis]
MYYKQTQLEAMASKKAAAEFQLEKEMKRLQEAQVEAEMSRVSRRASSSWEEDIDMKTLNFAEWSKTSRFWGCQGHTISVAISNCSNPAAFLFESCRIYGTRQPYFTMKGSSAGGHSQTMLALPICDDYNIHGEWGQSLCLVEPETLRLYIKTNITFSVELSDDSASNACINSSFSNANCKHKVQNSQRGTGGFTSEKRCSTVHFLVGGVR